MAIALTGNVAVDHLLIKANHYERDADQAEAERAEHIASAQSLEAKVNEYRTTAGLLKQAADILADAAPQKAA